MAVFIRNWFSYWCWNISCKHYTKHHSCYLSSTGTVLVFQERFKIVSTSVTVTIRFCLSNSETGKLPTNQSIRELWCLQTGRAKRGKCTASAFRNELLWDVYPQKIFSVESQLPSPSSHLALQKKSDVKQHTFWRGHTPLNPNVTGWERAAARELQDGANVYVVLVDKGNASAILDSSDYPGKIHTLIADPTVRF